MWRSHLGYIFINVFMINVVCFSIKQVDPQWEPDLQATMWTHSGEYNAIFHLAQSAILGMYTKEYY